MGRLTLRIWILIVILGLSLLAIRPSFESGVIVRSVEKNSSVFEAGLRQGEIIKSINGQTISDKSDYAEIVGGLFASGEEIRLDITTKNIEYTLLTSEPPLISVDDVPRTKIQTGLDLRGGARALIQADVELSDEELADLVEISRNRFDVFGLTDVNIKGITDLSGNKFMLIEVAGATPSDLEELIAKQGKFEAKIGNESVFFGGKQDISDVCRNDATCAGISGCITNEEGTEICNFRFVIYLTEEAAKRHAEITKGLSLDESGRYLSEKLRLFVDDQEADSLLISSDLKGQVATQIAIQGSGVGETREDAFFDAKNSMNKLQTIMITGSLPYKLEIVKLDTISPNLGSDFTNLILLGGGIAILLVAIIIFVRYKKLKASLALLFTALSELVIILGVAALIKWNLDLPSIAGILATVGTGVDQQIVILDEAERSREISIKERMKRALFVIGTAYLTTVASLIPLYWAGAGLFKGFAFTTIIGITAGVLITRPAFADMVKKIEG